MLRESTKGFIFEDERLLEDFLWENLSDLNLIPLKRQLGIKGEYCDILAATHSKQGVIIELKNCEDRYVVQQLTRYYHGIRLEQPLSDYIDYEQPIRLIAIAPDFHRHNFIDREYCKLNIEFVRLSIIKNFDNLHLHLSFEAKKELTLSSELEYKPDQRKWEIQKEQIAPPPRFLINLLNKLSPDQKEKVLDLRTSLLQTDKKIKEIKGNKNVIYGRGTTKPCCQFKLYTLSISEKTRDIIQIFLWLPLPKQCLKRNEKPRIGRLYIETDNQLEHLLRIYYWPQSSRTTRSPVILYEQYCKEISSFTNEYDLKTLCLFAANLNLQGGLPETEHF